MAVPGLTTDFAGQKGPLFALALKTSILTVLTLGIYRFWMKTRLRRYYWSSVRPGGHPLEYLGEPVEKLLGFLIAVVVLAFYIGVVNLVLMFLSFAFLHGNATAYAVSFIGVIPIWFFALYRARRYVLARTRWRGLRFGLLPGAWGYSWRAVVHWAITILTLGVLWPRKTFWLEKYKTDRTVLGTWTLHQGGSWRMLFRPYVPVIVSISLILTAAVFLYFEDWRFFALLGLGCAGLPVAAIHYQVRAWALLANHKTAGSLGLEARPRTRRVLGIYTLGYFLISVIIGLVLAAAGVLVSVPGAAVGPGEGFQFQPWYPIVGAAAYFAVFILWGVLGHVFVTLPLWRHYAETLTVTGAEDLSGLRQRARDEFREAEGFAEALDLGAAI